MKSVSYIIRNGIWSEVLSQVRFTGPYRQAEKNILVPLSGLIRINIFSPLKGAIRVDKEFTV